TYRADPNETRFFTTEPRLYGESELVRSNDSLFFTAYTPAHGFELWRYSFGAGTEPALVKDITPGLTGSVRSLTDVDGVLYFLADDGVTGPELWRSDGTEVGTQLVLDIYPGSVGSFPRVLTNVSGTLYFTN